MASNIDSVDLNLSVLCAVALPGETLSQADIAEVVGCSRSNIYFIEKKALNKMKVKLGNKKDWID